MFHKMRKSDTWKYHLFMACPNTTPIPWLRRFVFQRKDYPCDLWLQHAVEEGDRHDSPIWMINQILETR